MKLTRSEDGVAGLARQLKQSQAVVKIARCPQQQQRGGSGDCTRRKRCEGGGRGGYPSEDSGLARRIGGEAVVVIAHTLREALWRVLAKSQHLRYTSAFPPHPARHPKCRKATILAREDSTHEHRLVARLTGCESKRVGRWERDASLREWRVREA